MSNQQRPLFDSSFAALTLVNRPRSQEFASRAAPPVQRPKRGNTTAMSIRFAPESEPTANALELQEEQTTGPLALGFEFELFGVYYTRFELSPNGFIAFGTESNPCDLYSAQHLSFIPLNEDLSNFIALWYIDAFPPGPRRIAYELRGSAQRHRLVVSFTTIPSAAEERAATAQVVLHERTGMIEVHATTRDVRGARIDEASVRYTTSPGRVRALDSHHC
jgi:hypothetical protein